MNNLNINNQIMQMNNMNNLNNLNNMNIGNMGNLGNMGNMGNIQFNQMDPRIRNMIQQNMLNYRKNIRIKEIVYMKKKIFRKVQKWKMKILIE